MRSHAKDAGIEYERIPCLGHPVFNKDAVNHDPREVVIRDFIKESGKTNVFLEFYHHVAQGLKDTGCTSRVMAVNVDAAVACVWLSICWDQIKEKHDKISFETSDYSQSSTPPDEGLHNHLFHR